MASAACLLFGSLVLAGGPRRMAHLLLAAFLFLIAGNQAVEAYRAVDPAVFATLGSFRGATLFAVADPLLLYAFAAMHPQRNRLARPARWAPLLAAAVLLAGWALWVPTTELHDLRFMLGELALAAYTATAYVAVWAWWMRPAAQDDGPSGDPAGSRLIFAALCFATIPAAERATADLAYVAYLLARDLDVDLLRVAMWVPLFGAVVAVAWWRTRRGSEPARAVRRWSLLGILLAVALSADTVVAALAQLGLNTGASFGVLGRGAAAVRWLLFGGLVSVAVLRHEMLGMSLGLRRVAARLLVAFAFAAAAVFAFAFTRSALGRTAIGLRPVEVAILATVLLLSQGFRALVDRVAVSWYGLPDRRDPSAAADAYRAAVLQAHEGGLAANAAALGRLRRELGLDGRTADAIEDAAARSLEGPLAAGLVLAGRFRVVRFLGRGGAGRAFLAQDELLQRTIVLKEVLLDGPDQEAAVLREARLAAGLQHPNVVTLHDVVRRPGSVLLVCEHVAGGPLQDLLDAGGPDADAAFRIADGLLAGLEAIHARGIVHRDLKPGNVLLQPDGTPKIADFGIAQPRRGMTARYEGPSDGPRDGPRPRPGAIEGTPGAMSPEQRRGEVATPASDLYQAGLLLRALFPRPPAPGVASVVRRALRPAPEERWPGAAEMREALRQARQAGSAAGAPPARGGGRAKPKPARRPKPSAP